MIQRARAERLLATRLSESPVVALLGPRQCGKTTLARPISDPAPARAVPAPPPSWLNEQATPSRDTVIARAMRHRDAGMPSRTTRRTLATTRVDVRHPRRRFQHAPR